MTVRQVLINRLGALPVIRAYLERLQLKECVDARAPVREVAQLTTGEVVTALVANRLTARDRWTTAWTGPRRGPWESRSGSDRPS